MLGVKEISNPGFADQEVDILDYFYHDVEPRLKQLQKQHKLQAEISELDLHSQVLVANMHSRILNRFGYDFNKIFNDKSLTEDNPINVFKYQWEGPSSSQQLSLYRNPELFVSRIVPFTYLGSALHSACMDHLKSKRGTD